MSVCDFCKEDKDMLFKCIHCGELFCREHRLPKNHLCLEEMIPENRIKRNDEISNIDKSEEKTHKKKYEKVNNPLKIPYTIPILLLIILSVSAQYSLYFFAYNLGYDEAYNIKYTEGEQVGYQTGFNQGFEEAFHTGNITGYESGLYSGVENGEAKGYQQGFFEGENIGENMGFIEGNKTGFLEYYQYGLDDIENRGFNLSYPSFPQVSSFIKKDETDKEWYISGIFDDNDFAQKVKENAFKNGIHCYYVKLHFIESPSHAIVAFNTTDRGIMFYEPQTDESVNVEIGIRYWRDRGLNTYLDDTITGIEFVW